VLLAKAHAEGLRATPEEVERAVQSMIEDLKARFPSEDAFRAQLLRENMTLEKLEATYRSRMRDQLDIGKLIERDVRSAVTVSETELRAYYDAHRDEIPAMPASLELRRIRISLRSVAAADSSAFERARIVRERLAAGEDFATLAKIFSEGPEAAKGGDLGWFREGDLEPSLEAAVQGVEVGKFSDLVTSSRGTHILRVEERDGTRFHLRQIVFLRDESAVKTSARARAEAIRRRVESGEDFLEVAKVESDEGADVEQRGRVVQVAVEALDPRLRSAVETLEVGQISEIVEDAEGVSIFKVEGREGARDPTFEEIRDRLEQVMRQDKIEKVYDEYTAKVRRETYVEIVPERGS
jgi:peptidyl-prolyl cis-trans isomerase SurA